MVNTCTLRGSDSSIYIFASFLKRETCSPPVNLSYIYRISSNFTHGYISGIASWTLSGEAILPVVFLPPFLKG